MQGYKSVLFFVGDLSLSATAPNGGDISQGGQSNLIMDILALNTMRRSHYFVDLASNNATFDSNTFLLEARGWDGVCIEANPEYFWRLAQRRCQLVAAAVSSRQGTPITFALNGGWGSIADAGLDVTYDPKAVGALPKVYLQTVSLESVLARVQAPSLVSYLSLDVEGAEFDVLSRFPFDRYTFLTLTIERPSTPLRQLLHERGFRFVWCLTWWGEALFVDGRIFGTQRAQAHIGRAIERHVERRREKSEHDGISHCPMNFAGEQAAKLTSAWRGVHSTPQFSRLPGMAYTEPSRNQLSILQSGKPIDLRVYRAHGGWIDP